MPMLPQAPLDTILLSEEMDESIWIRLQEEYLNNPHHKLVIKDKGIFHLTPFHDNIPASFQASLFWQHNWEICFKDGFSIQTGDQLKLLWNGVLSETQMKKYEIEDNVISIKQLQ